MNARLVPLAAVSAFGLLVLTGCVANAPAGSAGASLTVDSSADACTVSAEEAPAGNLSFSITNSGDQVTEFYLLADDGLRIDGEAENIGQGLTRDLVMQLAAGEYVTACKPGMTGDGIGKAGFIVTASDQVVAVDDDLEAQIETANVNDASSVRDQVAQLVTGTDWHAIEKDLWPADAEAGFLAYPAAERRRLADRLMQDTATLNEEVQTLSFTLSQQTNGAIGLLDEVATGKVTGEEEFWSHTDLWDFQANVDGAAVLYAGVRDILVDKDAARADSLDTEFAALQTLLDAQRVGDGFTLYTELSEAEIKALARQVNTLGEPLNQRTATLVL